MQSTAPSARRKYPVDLRKRANKKMCWPTRFWKKITVPRMDAFQPCADQCNHRERICWFYFPRFSLVTQIGRLRRPLEGDTDLTV
jgi:hypothetical protein